MALHIRRATHNDIARLLEIMDGAIGRLMDAFLTPAQVEASREVMGLDTQLIADGTYLAACEGETILGCGGWSDRATLFGGDHSAGRDAARLVPGRDRARVRAMYTAPEAARRGVGRAILSAAEGAARAAGFSELELAATKAGEPLYLACGYLPELAFDQPTSGGITVPLIRMVKRL